MSFRKVKKIASKKTIYCWCKNNLELTSKIMIKGFWIESFFHVFWLILYLSQDANSLIGFAPAIWCSCNSNQNPSYNKIINAVNMYLITKTGKIQNIHDVIYCVYSWLSRSNTAMRSCTGLVTVGPTKAIKSLLFNILGRGGNSAQGSVTKGPT